jgi:hypothetical protein
MTTTTVFTLDKRWVRTAVAAGSCTSHVFHVDGWGTVTARMDLINALDKEYQIRNGTGVGVGAPQYGARRGLFVGLSKSIGHAAEAVP